MARQQQFTMPVTIGGVGYGAGASNEIITSIDVQVEDDEEDVSAQGDTVHRFESGLGKGTCTIEFLPTTDLSDFTTLNALKGTIVAITYRAENAAISTANPEYQFSVLWSKLLLPGGAHGSFTRKSITLQLDTVVTTDVTP